jgi:hypothetical protein
MSVVSGGTKFGSHKLCEIQDALLFTAFTVKPFIHPGSFFPATEHISSSYFVIALL